MSYNNKRLPKRTILVRHGESEGNLDTAVCIYDNTRSKDQLTYSGLLQAHEAGARHHALISSNRSSPSGVSTSIFVHMIGRDLCSGRLNGRSSVVVSFGVREECRIREQKN
ncbi:unnamed protein product [Eruca vesicaria subsp. sativa]|uniref:Uncharacterized protein n=1 Tax=Eruca vesicaria subsp. sativa TaxID=29727 RepID=A0ABC8KRI6_ERUVS|nr:unnamed protein product [Eruca vesicaria subsp. sativa]